MAEPSTLEQRFCACEHHAYDHLTNDVFTVEPFQALDSDWAMRLGPCSGCDCPRYDPRAARTSGRADG